jgi:hypothetical protein
VVKYYQESATDWGLKAAFSTSESGGATIVFLGKRGGDSLMVAVNQRKDKTEISEEMTTKSR